jgi:carbon storage regulator
VLVFTRKRDEAIVIGNGIEIRVVRIGKDGVRLGITAPADVPVHRSEIYRLVEASNASAASNDASLVSSLAARLRTASEPSPAAAPEPVKAP